MWYVSSETLLQDRKRSRESRRGSLFSQLFKSEFKTLPYATAYHITKAPLSCLIWLRLHIKVQIHWTHLWQPSHLSWWWQSVQHHQPLQNHKSDLVAGFWTDSCKVRGVGFMAMSLNHLRVPERVVWYLVRSDVEAWFATPWRQRKIVYTDRQNKDSAI